MLTLYEFQKTAVMEAVGRKSVVMDARLGAGKTVVGAAWLQFLRTAYRFRRMVIIAPRRVLDHGWKPTLAEQCPDALVLEPSDLKDLLDEDIDGWHIALLSNRSLKNALHKANRIGVDAVIIDEPTTVLKGINAQRLRAWLKRDNPEFRLALSATPWARGLESLWALYALVHETGQPFGYKTQTEYMRETHEDKAPRHLNFPIWRPRKGAERRLIKQAGSMTMTMVPDFKEIQSTTSDQHFILRGEGKARYADLKKSIVNEDGKPASGGVKVLALRRLIQREKHKALVPFFKELREPCLVWCEFLVDREAIHQSAAMADLESADVGQRGAIEAWNKRQIDVLVANPAEAGPRAQPPEGRAPHALVHAALEP